MPTYGLYGERSERNANPGKNEAGNMHNSRQGRAFNSDAGKRGMQQHLPGAREQALLRGLRQTAQEWRFGNKYRNILNDAERCRQAKSPGTELYRKEKNALAVESAEKKRAERQKARALVIAARTGVRMYNPTLQTISRFMTGNDKEDRLLLTRFNSRNSVNKTRALTRMIRLFLKLDHESLNVTSEKQIAENAGKLENLSEKFFALQYLITVSPETYNALNAQFKDRFERQYEKAQRVVTFYRLKKQVMTNEYYRTHQNNEIGREISDKDTAEQKLLSELILQSEEGIELLLRDTCGRVCKETVKNLADALRSEKADGGMQRFRERLAQKQERFRRLGPGAGPGNDPKEWEIRPKDARAPERHAENIERLELTGDPKKDAKSITEITDQLDILEELSAFREKNPDSYFIEQSDRRVSICEAALAAKNVFKRLREDMILLSGPQKPLSGGGRKKTVTGYAERYKNDLKEYNALMDSFEETEKRIFDPGKASDPFDPGKAFGLSDRKFGRIKRTQGPDEAAQKLLLDLCYAENSFSDADICRYTDEIEICCAKLAGTEEGEIFARLKDRAEALRKEKRYQNLKELKEREHLAPEFEQEFKLLESEHNKRRGYKAGQYEIPGADETYGPILALRDKAKKLRLRFDELKERTAHYMYQ